MNLATLIVGVIVVLAVVLVIRVMLKDHKNGGCGGNCSGCSGNCDHCQ